MGAFDYTVESVQVSIWTQGANLQAKVELLQGPNCVRQVIDLEEDYGYDRPFSCVLDTPGWGSVIRIINTGPMVFPIVASVVPYTTNDGSSPVVVEGLDQSDSGGYDQDFGNQGGYGQGFGNQGGYSSGWDQGFGNQGGYSGGYNQGYGNQGGY